MINKFAAKVWFGLDENMRDNIRNTKFYRFAHRLLESESTKACIKYDQNSVYIWTIAKSGTNAIRLLLTNYINIYLNDSMTPVLYKEMDKDFFPNTRDYFNSTGYVKPVELPEDFPFRDILYGHHSDVSLLRSDSPILFCYRNPLDYLVSRYFYTFKYRPERENLYSHPRETVDQLLPSYIQGYKAWKNISRQRKNTLAITYEQMMDCPYHTFNTVINHIGLPVDSEKLTRAISFSSIDNTKRSETQNGAIHSPDGFTGKFARNGSIGQWQEYFDDKDVKLIEEKLNIEELTLSSFCLVSKQGGWSK